MTRVTVRGVSHHQSFSYIKLKGGLVEQALFFPAEFLPPSLEFFFQFYVCFWLLFFQKWQLQWLVLQQGKQPRQYGLNYYTDDTKGVPLSLLLDQSVQ